MPFWCWGLLIVAALGALWCLLKWGLLGALLELAGDLLESFDPFD